MGKTNDYRTEENKEAPLIYDIHTKNISFLKVSKTLRENGVKNNKFMLTLYDEDLVGVDPHSKEVDKNPELQFKIYREICRNFRYFIREVCLIPADGAEIKYELNLGNCTLSYLKLKNKNLIMILPRQHGKTMGQTVYDVWLLCFATTNSNCIYLNKGKSDAIKNLKLWRDIKALLPRWLLDNYVADYKKDIDNQESKLVAKRNNTLKIVAPANDPDQAEKNRPWFDSCKCSV